jgi:RNA polymerase sigma factor (sigma-70 family)
MNLQEIYQRQHQRVYRVAMLYLKNIQDAEDVVQTVFLKWIQREVHFQSEEHENAWFITVTRNCCRDLLRTFWRRKVDLGEIPEREFYEKEEGEYELYIYETDTKSFLETVIALDVDTQETEQIEQTLPKFVYTGEDKAIQAICEYLAETEEEEDDENSVWIPSFVIFKEAKAKGEYLVFGNFWSDSYKLTGNILESTSGGEMPACFHLIKDGEGYQVASVEQAGDGTNYAKDIKNFTKGYWGLYRKYMDYEAIQEARDKAQKEYLQMYVRDNQLDVKYFKEFGWDPVEIFEEK